MRWTAALVVSAALVGADASGDKAKKDQEAFQGTWVVVTAERDGKQAPASDLKHMKLVIDGDHFTFHGPNGEEAGTFKLDPTTSPKAIDVMPTSGPDKGKIVLGIYELDGTERHRACFASPGKDRPKAFSAGAGSGNELYEMKQISGGEGGSKRQRRHGG